MTGRAYKWEKKTQEKLLDLKLKEINRPTLINTPPTLVSDNSDPYPQIHPYRWTVMIGLSFPRIQ